jgi:hypothetical protein
VKVDSQVRDGFPENVSYERAGVRFAALHIVGSNNSLLPWTGNTAPTPEQQAEVQKRTAATLTLIDDTFREARKDEKGRAVVLLTQADMFDPTVANPQFADYSAFQPIVREIAVCSRPPTAARSTCSTETATSTTPTPRSHRVRRGSPSTASARRRPT